MGGESGSPATEAAKTAAEVDEERRAALLRRITEEGGFAFVSSAEKAAGGDLREAEAAREMAWEQLHLGPWHEVVPAWRDAYAMACLHVAELRAGAGDRREALQALDMGLIMGGSLLRRDLDEAVHRIAACAEDEVVADGCADKWREGISNNRDLAEVIGRKYIRLYPASASGSLYPHTESMLSNSSQVDLDNIDFTEFPKVENLDFLDCVLEEGEMLYIPPKWWHYVRSLSTSFSVSFWWSATAYPSEGA
ncbi:hypothetical protein GW17_00060644 [Ensete ventricosum]|nr:hypothetical protein GW17_00060644 [Ensete ventricosum]